MIQLITLILILFILDYIIRSFLKTRLSSIVDWIKSIVEPISVEKLADISPVCTLCVMSLQDFIMDCRILMNDLID